MISEELKPITWHLKKWWNFACEMMRKEKQNQFLLSDDDDDDELFLWYG